LTTYVCSYCEDKKKIKWRDEEKWNKTWDYYDNFMPDPVKVTARANQEVPYELIDCPKCGGK
jgi:DNA-directed RNA polymerase subunit RPC12/RpoP